jgi:hypothetical protein
MEEKTKKIDPHIASWTTPEGFEALFCRMCGEYSTYQRAYQAAERMYSAQFGRNRYSSYDSFKNTKNRKLRNRETK